MVAYSIISQRFNYEYRNGSTFATNPTTDYSVDLKGNPGELIKLTQTVEMSVTINQFETSLMTFNSTADATYGEFVAPGINFLSEGMYAGATLDVFGGGMTGTPISVTVGMVTGTLFNTLKITKANLLVAGLVDGTDYTNIIIRLTSAPAVLIYKYGLNENSSSGTNYTSWFDANEQAYGHNALTGSLQTLSPVGLGIISWNLSTSIQAKFDATVGTYFHQYTVEHIFRMPYYVEGEYENINDGTSPAKFMGTNSVRYDNAYYFGGVPGSTFIKADIQGAPGNVGYFKESYNGFANDYLIQNVAIANADNSGVLEGTVVNTLTFQIKNTASVNFTTASKVILYHSKLPTSTEYQNKPTAFDTIWMFERLVTTESAGAVSGTIITNFDITLNADPTILDVTADIQYTAGQQALISDTANYLLWVTVGNVLADPDNRISLPVHLSQFSKNLDVTGLVDASTTAVFFEPFEFNTGSRRIVSWTGWNGDLGGAQCSLIKNATIECLVRRAYFKIISKSSTEELELLSIEIPIGKPQLVVVGGNTYQILNVDVQGSFNLPATTPLNRLKGTATVPAIATTTQLIAFEVGFQTPWRKWVFNNTVPNSLYDAAEEQNNQNYKTSNYSNVDGFEVFPCWEFVMLSDGNVETTYRKMTFEANVNDFDLPGTPFTAVTKYYDESNQLTSNIFVDQNVRIEIEFTHSSGVISKTDLEAYIWIERDGSQEQPNFLHSSIDLTSPTNPLTPSSVVTSTNYQFVEIKSVSNLITIICLTNRDNLQDGVNYNIYGRIKNKTIA